MTRSRSLFAALGLFAVTATGLFYFSAPSSPAEASVGPGRYRDGRGRFGREGADFLAAAAAGGGGGAVNQCPSCLTDLWVYYPLDSSPVDVVGARNGAMTGTATYTASGKLGQAGLFAGGSNNFFSLPAVNLQPGSPSYDAFSVAAWIYPTSYPASYGTIISEGGDAEGLYLKADGSVTYWTFTAGGDHSSAAGAVPLNAWSYIVLTYVYDSDWKMYVNGAVSGSGTVVSGSGLGASSLTKVGGGSSGSPLAFIGRIDEPAGWRKTLSPAEVTSLTNSGNGLPYSSF